MVVGILLSIDSLFSVVLIIIDAIWFPPMLIHENKPDSFDPVSVKLKYHFSLECYHNIIGYWRSRVLLFLGLQIQYVYLHSDSFSSQLYRPWDWHWLCLQTQEDQSHSTQWIQIQLGCSCHINCDNDHDCNMYLCNWSGSFFICFLLLPFRNCRLLSLCWSDICSKGVNWIC